MITMGLLGLRSKVALGFTWDSYGLSVVLLWSAYEIPIELLYRFIEVSTQRWGKSFVICGSTLGL